MNARNFAMFLGVIFVFVGIAGFIPGLNRDMHMHDPNLTVTDPGPYAVFVDLFANPLPGPLAAKLHSWNVPPTNAGNLTVAPASQPVTLGKPATVTASWTGLSPTSHYLGLVGYSAHAHALGGVHAVTDYGAVGDGTTDDGPAVTLSAPDGSRRVSVWADGAFGWWQVFTGDPLGPPRGRRALAVEPMTCPPDAWRSGHDVVALEPGGTWRGSWGIRPELS